MAAIEKVTPEKGKVGNVALIHGEGLEGAKVVVKFGRTTVANAEMLNDKVIKVTVPSKSALDQNPVTITVIIDGQPVSGQITFDYQPPGPEPTITNITPNWVKRGEPFTLTVTGTNFTTNQGREPSEVFFSGGDCAQGTFNGTATATTFKADFIVEMPGSGLLYVGFSDGSGVVAPEVVVG